MGIDRKVYVGPYIECAVRIVDRPYQRRTCSASSCPRYKVDIFNSKIKFCELCGNSVKYRELTDKGSIVSAGDVSEDLNDQLAPIRGSTYDRYSEGTGAHIWISNLIKFEDEVLGRIVSFDPDHEDFLLFPITPDQINRNARRTIPTALLPQTNGPRVTVGRWPCSGRSQIHPTRSIYDVPHGLRYLACAPDLPW